MAKSKSVALAVLQRAARSLAKSKPDKAHAPIYDTLTIAALAGKAAAAQRLHALLRKGALPPPKHGVITALSTQALEVWAHVTQLATSARLAELQGEILARVTGNAYFGDYPTDDSWRKKPRSDPFFAIDRYRRAQLLAQTATPKSEAAALALLGEILADWPPEVRGAGNGNELVLACDLALRLGKGAALPGWLAAHGPRILGQDLIETMLCFPAIATAMAAGAFRQALDATDAELEQGLAAVEEAARSLAAASPAPLPKALAPGKVTKRKLGIEYAQLYLEPALLSSDERRHRYFEDPKESQQGLSLFPTHVGIATPSETESVAVEIVGEPAGEPDLSGVVQAVAFPIEVRAPLVLRGVSDEGDEPFPIAPGSYDVLATFAPLGKPRGGLRRFLLRLSFRPAKSLAAPRCLLLEDGSAPPKKIVHGRGS